MTDGDRASVPSDEDRKLLVLARGAMARAESATGAAVRDIDGRTYAGAAIDRAALRLSALQVALATALSSGAPGFEAAVLIGRDDPAADPGLALLHELTPSAPAYAAQPGSEILTPIEGAP
ncbi:cytidine deaminase [Jongsikchunia kroppenstedtii]|uniref:cytidine deaminase n=1 Tax=Jongsikchunia kroppenstedtii TaxID=1121721 RepID=UPI000381D99C|nr:cytidine deaminase [Jongsikchunia kroppenstedtii]